ncbi:MAG TPA: extracellular solute-binding protein, partial [Spirochaetia bacterium]|nr:extracellular solute-binding protein [Spirochaetia bacterium]
MKKLCTVLVVLALAAGAAAAQTVVRYWYHLDDPNATIDNLIQKFQNENPTVTLQAERIPWGSYNQKLMTAVAANDAPDVFEVKLWWQPQLVEMGALAPIDSYLTSWPLKSDVFPNVWQLTRYTDGTQ